MLFNILKVIYWTTTNSMKLLFRSECCFDSIANVETSVVVVVLQLNRPQTNCDDSETSQEFQKHIKANKRNHFATKIVFSRVIISRARILKILPFYCQNNSGTCAIRNNKFGFKNYERLWNSKLCNRKVIEAFLFNLYIFFILLVRRFCL